MKHASGCRECKKVVKELAAGLVAEGVAVPLLEKVFKGHVSRRWLYYKRNEYAGNSKP